jgi:hypothetical protein
LWHHQALKHARLKIPDIDDVTNLQVAPNKSYCCFRIETYKTLSFFTQAISVEGDLYYVAIQLQLPALFKNSLSY